MPERRTGSRLLFEEMPAVVIDRERLHCVNATVRDFNKTGCQVVCDRLDEFPDQITLQIRGVEEMLLCDVVWRKDGVAGVNFGWTDASGDNKRQEERFKVHIPATIFNRSGKHHARCEISEASRSGCRIEINDMAEFYDDDDVHIKIRTMRLPIKGKIIWRGDKCAGVKLHWKMAMKAPNINEVSSSVDLEAPDESTDFFLD